jgi:hypothetical protein
MLRLPTLWGTIFARAVIDARPRAWIVPQRRKAQIYGLSEGEVDKSWFKYLKPSKE